MATKGLVIMRTAKTEMQWRSILGKLNKVKDGTARAMPDALMYAFLPIFQDSQMMVPVDTGHLRASGYLRKVPAAGRKQARVEMGYDADYAMVVHEDMSKSHQGTTQAKFLEQPVQKHKGKMQERIAYYLRMAQTGSIHKMPDEVKGRD